MKKVNHRKIQILDAAAHLLADKGNDKFTLRNVAQECGIHLKTLQYYFPSKRELLNEVLDLFQQLVSE